MAAPPLVDVNLIFHNAAATLDGAIASVVAQTWPNWRLTLLDDGSTDGGPEIARFWAARDGRIALKRHRANQGIVGAYRRAFTHGDADFVMPKSADDLIAPEFIEALMGVLVADPEVAMCHAGALNIGEDGEVVGEVPAHTRLDTPAGGPLPRAMHVMQRYAFSPSFWGIYRREALDLASQPMACGGWDHAFLAEIALYGHIRHVPAPLFLRRGGPAPLWRLARNAGMAWSRNRSQGDVFADVGAMAPAGACAWAHVETFSLARLPAPERAGLIEAARDILRARWSDAFDREAELLAARLPALLGQARGVASGGATGAAARLRIELMRTVEGLLWVLEPGRPATALMSQWSALSGLPPAREQAA
jgi:hypothetical protein